MTDLPTTYAGAIQYLRDAATGLVESPTLAQLEQLVANMSVVVPNTTATLLYSGVDGQGTRVFGYAQDLAAQDIRIAIVDRTEAARLVTSADFREAATAQLGSVTRSKPTRVRLLPNLGITYRQKLVELRQAISEGDNAEALEKARALIARIVVHPAPPRKPPGIVVEAGLASLLTTAQPDLPAEIASQIAEAVSVVVKEGARGRSPLATRWPAR